MSTLPDMAGDGAERRVATRVRTLKRATILFNNHFSTFDCILRNISATGALLTIDQAAHLPKTFDIRIGDDKETRPGKLVYRRGMLAGIRFLDVISEEEEQAVHFPDAPQLSASGTQGFPDETTNDEPGYVERILAPALPRAILTNLAWFSRR